MYSIYFGNDTQAVRAAAQQAIDVAGKGGATINRIDSDSYEPGFLADALGASSLFGGEELYVIDTPSSVSEFNDEVVESLAAMAESTNVFIVIEDTLLAAAKKKYEKHAAHSEEFKAEKKEDILNPFQLADALAAKDKRKLWLLLREMQQDGLPAEELIGILWWQLKSMRLASFTKTAAEAGMKDFPYNKAKRALIKFSSQEIKDKSESLLSVYHDGHMSRRDINDALEHWVLAL